MGPSSDHARRWILLAYATRGRPVVERTHREGSRQARRRGAASRRPVETLGWRHRKRQAMHGLRKAHPPIPDGVRDRVLRRTPSDPPPRRVPHRMGSRAEATRQESCYCFALWWCQHDDFRFVGSSPRSGATVSETTWSTEVAGSCVPSSSQYSQSGLCLRFHSRRCFHRVDE